MTVQLDLTNASAIEAPSPEEAPVTTMVLPLHLPSCIVLTLVIPLPLLPLAGFTILHIAETLLLYDLSILAI